VILDLGKQAGKILRFTYTDQHGDKTNRAVYVYGNHPNGDLDTYCFQRMDRRRFHPRSMNGVNVVPAEVKAVPISQLPGTGSSVNSLYKNEGFETWVADGTLYAMKQSRPSFETMQQGRDCVVVTVTNGANSDAFRVTPHGIRSGTRNLTPEGLLQLLTDVLQ